MSKQAGPGDVDVVVDVVVDVRGQVQSADANRGGARLGLCLCRWDLAQAYMDGLGAGGKPTWLVCQKWGRWPGKMCLFLGLNWSSQTYKFNIYLTYNQDTWKEMLGCHMIWDLISQNGKKSTCLDEPRVSWTGLNEIHHQNWDFTKKTWDFADCFVGLTKHHRKPLSFPSNHRDVRSQSRFSK
jgi:hypothetical protein